MYDHEFNFEKFFQDAEIPFQTKNVKKRNIQYPRGSSFKGVNRAIDIVGNSHLVQEMFSKHLGIKK